MASSSWSARSTSPASRRRRAARSTRTPSPGRTRATARSSATISALGKLGVPCDKLPHRSNAANPIDNFFNSSISSGGANVPGRTPAYVNQLGFDLDTLALPEGAIPNNANGAAACLGTVGDTYFFGGIAFDVLIRAPNVHIAKSADRSEAAPGDLVTYTTTVTNPTRGPDDPLYPTPTVPATNLVVTDVLPSGLDFVDFRHQPRRCLRLRSAHRARSAVRSARSGSTRPSRYTYHARVSGAAQGAQANPLVNAACFLSNSEDQPDVTFNGCDEATVIVPAARMSTWASSRPSPTMSSSPERTLTWHVTGTNYGPAHVDRLRARGRAARRGDLRQRHGEPGAHLHHPRGRRGRLRSSARRRSSPAGTSVTLTIVGAVPSSTADGALLLNVATVNGNESEPVPDPHPNRDIAETTVARARSSRSPRRPRRTPIRTGRRSRRSRRRPRRSSLRASPGPSSSSPSRAGRLRPGAATRSPTGCG